MTGWRDVPTKKSANSPKTDKPWLFKPGQSGNPNGRPKDYITQAIRKIVTAEEAEALAKVLTNMALSGDLKAMEMVMDRAEGKPIARQEQGKPGDFDTLEPLRDLSSDDLRNIVKMSDRKAG